MGLKDRLKMLDLAVKPEERVATNRFKLEAGPDGIVRQPCWFCNAEVEFSVKDPNGETSIVMIEPVGTSEHMHGICHTSCAKRAQGSLAF